MKKIILVATVLVLCVLAGCKKSSTTTTASAAGFWTGTLNADGFELLLRSNGTARAYLASADTSLADKYDGTWVEGSDSLRAYWSIGGFGGAMAGKLNSAKTSMNCTVGSGTNTSGTGTVTMTKH